MLQGEYGSWALVSATIRVENSHTLVLGLTITTLLRNKAFPYVNESTAVEGVGFVASR